MGFRVLIAEDENITLKRLVNSLRNEGYNVQAADDGPTALAKIDHDNFDLLITDIKMPGMSGIELLEAVKERSPETEVITITGFSSVGSAVDAMKKGAHDYITKPFDLDELLLKVKKIYNEKKLIKENLALKLSLGIEENMPSVIANSTKMQQILQSINDMKDSDCNVLLIGETGVGKSLLARIIHSTGKRRAMPFLSINCANLTEELLSSEMFGHEKGSFTGAIKTKQGLVEIADTGTLFLDEIAEMSSYLQAKLLKIIEDQEFFRVGGTKPIRVDVRFIAATNSNVSDLISTGSFREDLYYRINVMEIFIPPLRDRRDDIEPLSIFFLDKHAARSNKKFTGFSLTALDILLNYHFPGNVRELENIIERATILEKSPVITQNSLPQMITVSAGKTTPVEERIKTLDEHSKAYAEKVIDMFYGNKSKAAAFLGISRTSLWRVLKKQ